MTDLLVWGGPVYCNTLDSVEWERPTKVLCMPANGSTRNAALYQGWSSLLECAHLNEDEVGRVGLAGFSAFHGFARAMLSDPAARDRVDYLHLADACFMGAGSTAPFSTFAWFAERAVDGNARMVATTNGPYGKDIHYTAGGTRYDLTSGARCVQLVWDEVTGGSDGDSATAPSGVPEPTFAKRAGELYWFHYESPPSGEDPHGWHANRLARPYVEAYGAPWLGRGATPSGGISVPVGGGVALLAVAAVIAAGAYLLAKRGV